MTGRDGGAGIAPIGNSPVVVLVRPQLADNIGACARAMANGGLFHLRLVAPRDGWPQEKAWRNSSGADRILDEATVLRRWRTRSPICSMYSRRVLGHGTSSSRVLTARGAAIELREICGRGICALACYSGPSEPGWIMTTWRRRMRWCAIR